MKRIIPIINMAGLILAIVYIVYLRFDMDGMRARIIDLQTDVEIAKQEALKQKAVAEEASAEARRQQNIAEQERDQAMKALMDCK